MQTAPLDRPPDVPEPDDDVELSAPDVPVFVEAAGDLRGSPPEQRAAHRERLEHAPMPRRFVVVRAGGRPVCTGLVALEDGLAGIYDVVTAPDARRRGHATLACSWLLAWAWQRGARAAYLQVDGENRPAHAVYRRFGFTTLYTYHYRGEARRMPMILPDDARILALAEALGKALVARRLAGRDGRVVHRRAGGRRHHRDRRQLGVVRPRVRDLHQREQGGRARRAGDADRAGGRGVRGGRAGDGRRRAGAEPGGSGGRGDGHRRTGRRKRGQAGGDGLLRVGPSGAGPSTRSRGSSAGTGRGCGRSRWRWRSKGCWRGSVDPHRWHVPVPASIAAPPPTGTNCQP